MRQRSTPSSSRRLGAVLVLGGTLILVFGATLVARAAAGGEDPTTAGLPSFVLSEFGGVTRATLETNALPYKVTATAVLMREERRRGASLRSADLPAIFQTFGFVYPERIGNWPAGTAQPHFARPLGMVGHVLSGPVPGVRIDAVTLGCSTCHAGLVYGADGRATSVAWAGLPNTSVNLQAYTRAVYEGLQLAVADQDRFRARVQQLFPEMGWSERTTLRFFVMPRVAKRMREFAAAGNVPLQFSNGGAGRTNGVASLKHMVGLPAGAVLGRPDVGFTSIPDLSGRALRSSLLYDGVYAPIAAQRFAPRDTGDAVGAHLDSLAAIVAFFTVPTMGVSTKAAAKAIPQMHTVMAWLGTRYSPPPFPGTIDSGAMRAGERLYDARCASCHGTYAEGRPRRLVAFPNRHVTQADMGTDSARWAIVDADLLERLRANEYGRHMDSERTGGYVAPILSGLWATAPYLHNGSVPTLWQLMTPAERPWLFYVGGHALDFTQLGIAGERFGGAVYRYPEGYVPWSTPELYDTRQPGLSNRGHEREFSGLSEVEKRALIEYLKSL